jgi:hypothetical protein
MASTVWPASARASVGSANVAQDLKPGSAGHHQVEHDAVVVHRPRLIAGLGAVEEHVHSMPFFCEAALDEAGNLTVVRPDQNAPWRRLPGSNRNSHQLESIGPP